MDFKSKILEILDSNGIYIDVENIENDIDLREYVTDSIQFISFIVEIEKQLEIEFPDEVLLYDKISSLNGFVNIIDAVVSGEYVPPEAFQSNGDHDPLEDDDYDEDDPYVD